MCINVIMYTKRLIPFRLFLFWHWFSCPAASNAGDVAICHLCLLLPLLPCQLFHSIVRVAKASAGNWVLLCYQLQLLQFRSAAAASAYVINNQHVSVSGGVMLERRCWRVLQNNGRCGNSSCCCFALILLLISHEIHLATLYNLHRSQETGPAGY